MQGPESFGGGMEYPTITVISPETNAKILTIRLLMKLAITGFMAYSPVMKEHIHGWTKESTVIMMQSITELNMANKSKLSRLYWKLKLYKKRSAY